MQNSFDTSFIPQEPILKIEGFTNRKPPMNLATVLSLVIFFGTLLVGGGVYYMDSNVIKQETAVKQQLVDKEKNINDADIEKYKNIDVRIARARDLIGHHTVFTPVLDLLSASTLSSIQLVSLSYDDGIIDLTGLAPSYEAVYSQGQVWKNMKQITKSDITSLELGDKSGVVSFKASFVVDPSFISYEGMFTQKSQDNSRTP